MSWVPLTALKRRKKYSCRETKFREQGTGMKGTGNDVVLSREVGGCLDERGQFEYGHRRERHLHTEVNMQSGEDVMYKGPVLTVLFGGLRDSQDNSRG